MWAWIHRHEISLIILAALIVVLLAAKKLPGAAEGAPAFAPEAGQAAATPEKRTTTWQEAVKMFAAALAISLCAFATAITQCRIGSAGVGALAENPKLFGSILIYLVIPETMVILGFVIAALILL